MSENSKKQIPLAGEDFQDLLSISEISSISSSDDSLSPPPPTIPIRKISLIERRGLHIDGLKIGAKWKDSSTQSSASDIPGPLSHLTHLSSRNLRRNSISLPSGLNTIDNEAIQLAHIDDKINENNSNGVNSIKNDSEIVRVEDMSSEVESDDDVPKYRNPKKFKKLYPLTFALCVIWIGANSYLIVWMMTVVGHTYSIPESVMGLTLLAAGGCMPEAISSVLMIRKGEGGIGVSNSLGANSLAILMSLGVPWLIRNIIYHNTTDKSFIVLNSYGIEYTISSLLVATILLYAVLSIAKYHLNKPVGFSLLAIYSIFLTVGVLMELNIIFPSGSCP